MSMDPKVLVEFEVKERGKETFISRGDLVDHKFNSYGADLLLFNIGSKFPVFTKYVDAVMRPNSELMVKEQDVEGLAKMLSSDTRLADYLGVDVVERLVMVLDKDVSISIKESAACILSHAPIDTFKDLITVKAIPRILCHLYERPSFALCRVVTALTRFACVSPEYVRVMLDQGALTFFKANSRYYTPGTLILKNFAKFLVIVCRANVFTLQEENVCAKILENILRINSHDYVHMERACYGLQYLSYKRRLEMDMDTIAKLFVLAVNQDNGVAGSALGVLGNIARWGDVSQIEFMASGDTIVIAFQRFLSDKPMKFQWELCQIICKVCDHLPDFVHPWAVLNQVKKLAVENILAALDILKSKRRIVCYGPSEAFKALNKLLEINVLINALKKHLDTGCFAEDLRPVSSLGEIDIYDLRLLYGRYFEDSLECGEMVEDKPAALDQLRKIFCLDESDADSIMSVITYPNYAREFVQRMTSGSLQADESELDCLQRYCNTLNIDAQKAVEIHEGIYLEKVHEFLSDGEPSDKDIQSLKQIQILLCIPDKSISRIYAKFSSKSSLLVCSSSF
ncbi:uncharacterized protein LOC141683548 isoform X2 [Apium graveolens]|uniref:uncharacterized protein LOC141683548 isoform X2 n=1 Tax=Apium graveolens TaxID=4045 RepID=UPI003D7B1E20